MIDTLEQFKRAEEAITKMKRFLLAARLTHAPQACAAPSAPTGRELQERERDVLAYLSKAPKAVSYPHGGRQMPASIAAALPRRSSTVAKITSPTTKKNPVDNMANR
jgi:hypothetical protein